MGKRRFMFALFAACAALLAGCFEEEPETLFQGYLEADYVRVAPAVAGTLQTLAVRRGDTLNEGDLLFALEQDNETSARAAALAELARAEAQLADLKKGKRPEEMAVAEAQLSQAKAALEMSALHVRQQRRLMQSGAVSREQLDEAQAAYERDQARVAELQAQIEVARLGARADAIAAAEAQVEAARAALAQAEWRLAKTTVNTPAAGSVEDTFYEPGEWVAAGSPVVSLLPPANVKILFFVPEPLLGGIRVGQMVTARCDGCPQPLEGRISFVADRAEFTPPVIYSRQSRSKLVYRVEAALPSEQAASLHPGQPVDVNLVP